MYRLLIRFDSLQFQFVILPSVHSIVMSRLHLVKKKIIKETYSEPARRLYGTESDAVWRVGIMVSVSSVSVKLLCFEPV